MDGLSSKEIKEKAKNTGIKNYKSLPIDKLLNILNEIKQAKKIRAVRRTRKENSDIKRDKNFV